MSIIYICHKENPSATVFSLHHGEKNQFSSQWHSENSKGKADEFIMAPKFKEEKKITFLVNWMDRGVCLLQMFYNIYEQRDWI